MWTQLELVSAQLKALAAARRALTPEPGTALSRYVDALPTLRGIGSVGA